MVWEYMFLIFKRKLMQILSGTSFCPNTYSFLIGSYTPPNDDEKVRLAEMINEWFIGEGWQEGTKWIWCGDQNEEIEESPSADVGAHYGGQGVTGMEGEATRWKGNKRIDWFMTNRPRVKPVKALPFEESDHKPLQKTIVTEERKETRQGKLKDTPSWRKPKGITPQNWKAKLTTIWWQMEADEEVNELEFKIKREKVEVEEEWRLFNESLDTLHRKPYLEVAAELQEKDSQEAKRLRSQAKAKRKKGGKGEHQYIPIQYEPKGEGDGSMRNRKRRNWKARVRELLRKLERHSTQKIRETKEGRALLKRVLNKKEKEEVSQEQAKKEIEEQLTKVNAEEKAEQEKVRKERLQEWRDKMRSGIQEVSKWIKRGMSEQVPVLEWKRKASETRSEATNFVK